MATSVPALGLLRAGPQAVAIQPIPGLGDPLSPPHQHAKFLPGTGSTGAGPSQVVAYLSIPKLGIKNAQVFDRGVDGGGNMLIAKGYAITHYANSSPIGSGNAVLYGHDDIEGSIFARLQELAVGDELDVTTSGGEAVVYHVTTPWHPRQVPALLQWHSCRRRLSSSRCKGERSTGWLTAQAYFRGGNFFRRCPS